MGGLPARRTGTPGLQDQVSRGAGSALRAPPPGGSDLPLVQAREDCTAICPGEKGRGGSAGTGLT